MVAPTRDPRYSNKYKNVGQPNLSSCHHMTKAHLFEVNKPLYGYHMYLKAKLAQWGKFAIFSQLCSYEHWSRSCYHLFVFCLFVQFLFLLFLLASICLEGFWASAHGWRSASLQAQYIFFFFVILHHHRITTHLIHSSCSLRDDVNRMVILHLIRCARRAPAWYVKGWVYSKLLRYP